MAYVCGQSDRRGLADLASLGLFSTAVLFWGQTGLIPSVLYPKRDCGPERVNLYYSLVVPSLEWGFPLMYV